MGVNPFWPALAVGVALVGFIAYGLIRRKKKPTVRDWRRIAIGVLVILAALRPTFDASLASSRVRDLDVVFLVDRSLSMVAEDYDGQNPRIDGVRSDVRKLMETYVGARFSIITFDFAARIELPFTTDTTAAATLIDVVKPRDYGQRGTSIDVALPLAETVLAQSQKQFPNRSRVLVYVGDGEQTLEAPPASFASLKPFLAGGLVLGYGTTAGGKMKDKYDDYLDNGDALSKIDEGNLQEIAKQIGGTYQHRTAPGPLEFTVSTGFSGSGQIGARDDWSWLVALVLLVPVMWEMWDALNARRRASALAGLKRDKAGSGGNGPGSGPPADDSGGNHAHSATPALAGQPDRLVRS